MADKKQNKNIDVPKKDQEEMPNQEEQLAEMESNWKRALADYQNLQKRVAEEKVNFTQFANGTLIRKLLPVLDSLEMIKEHFEDESIKVVVKEIKGILKDEGITEINAENAAFDATTMEAIEMVPGEKNTVVEVLKKGYLLRSRLLRPAEVNVGLGDAQKRADKNPKKEEE